MLFICALQHEWHLSGNLRLTKNSVNGVRLTPDGLKRELALRRMADSPRKCAVSVRPHRGVRVELCAEFAEGIAGVAIKP